MNAKYLIGMVIETIIKVVVIAAVVMFVFKTASKAYDFGYRIFADQPISQTGGRTISVSIEEDASVDDIAKMLQEKGLIEDANIFVLQERLSEYHGEIKPGIYDLSTSMTGEEMLAVLGASATEEGSEDINSDMRTSDEESSTQESTEESTEGMETNGEENQ